MWYELRVLLFVVVLLSAIDARPLFESSMGIAPAGFLTKSLTKDVLSTSSLGLTPTEAEMLGPLLTLLQVGGDSFLDSLLSGMKNICTVFTANEDKKTSNVMSSIQDPLNMPFLGDFLGGKSQDSDDSKKKSSEGEKSSGSSSSGSDDSSTTTTVEA